MKQNYVWGNIEIYISDLHLNHEIKISKSNKTLAL